MLQLSRFGAGQAWIGDVLGTLYMLLSIKEERQDINIIIRNSEFNFCFEEESQKLSVS